MYVWAGRYLYGMLIVVNSSLHTMATTHDLVFHIVASRKQQNLSPMHHAEFAIVIYNIVRDVS